MSPFSPYQSLREGGGGGHLSIVDFLQGDYEGDYFTSQIVLVVRLCLEREWGTRILQIKMERSQGYVIMSHSTERFSGGL